MVERRKIRRLLAPLVLIVAGVWVLVGCVYIPTFGTRMAGKDVAKSVGHADSRKPIRVSRATVADVLRVLGEPPFATDDRRVFAYPWTVRNGIAVWPLCFAAYPVRGQRTLVLRFDTEDVLGSFEVLKRDEPAVNLYYNQKMLPVLPQEIERERWHSRPAGVHPWAPSTRPATSPATQPE